MSSSADFFGITSKSGYVYMYSCSVGACINSTCTTGYEGFLCASCSTGFFTSLKSNVYNGATCNACADQKYKILEVSITFLLGLFIISGLVWVKIKSISSKVKTRVLSVDSQPQNVSSTPSNGETKTSLKSNSSIIQRMLLSHLQLLAILG